MENHKESTKPIKRGTTQTQIEGITRTPRVRFLKKQRASQCHSSSALSHIKKNRHPLKVLQNHKGEIAWSIADIKGIDSSFCTHKILMEDEFKLSIQPQRQVNPNIKEVVPEKGGITVVKNEKDELIPQ
ncbi:hypothetical protein Tco_0992650 [Tanacetum coccineum]|uniref:Uncharacterized protein n=1 Tax=Tanacetum coccineum TaxID=301880 RepID=A0ABQ5F2P7_9ASTR